MRPILPPAGLDALGVERGRDRLQGHPLGSHGDDPRGNERVEPIRRLRMDPARVGGPGLPPGVGQAPALLERGAELPAPGLVGGQGCLGPLGDPARLVFGDGREDVDREAVGGRVVTRDELRTRLHQVREERYVAGEPVQLGDDQRGLGELGVGQRPDQFGPVVGLGLCAGLYLGISADDRAACRPGVGAHGRLLALKAETAGTLLLRGHAIVRDQLASHVRTPGRPVRKPTGGNVTYLRRPFKVIYTFSKRASQ